MNKGFRLARDLRLLHDLASPIHNANAPEFQRRRFRHSAPRLSSISDAWGRLNIVTPFHHLSGDSHLHRSLGAGPITASSQAIPAHYIERTGPPFSRPSHQSPQAMEAVLRGFS